MDVPKPGSWITPKVKKPFIRKDHLTQRPFKNLHDVTNRKQEKK